MHPRMRMRVMAVVAEKKRGSNQKITAAKPAIRRELNHHKFSIGPCVRGIRLLTANLPPATMWRAARASPNVRQRRRQGISLRSGA